ncbi:MAG: two-component regulator propeller domain-containing protein [Bacteroidota bacterium]
MLRDLGRLILFLVLSTCSVLGQDYRIENITSEYIRIEKGLSQNSVICILQDQEGYLWVGTWSGLNRFDGYTFRTFTKNQNEPQKGLVQPTIVGLAEDRNGYIWAASSVGLNRIRKNDFSITQFTAEKNRSNGMVCDSIFTLFSDRSGNIWIGTTCGAFILDPDSLKFTQIEHNPRNIATISSNKVTAFAQDTSGAIWIGTQHGLNKYNTVTGQIIRYYAGQSTGNLASNVISCLTVDANNNLWIGSPAGLHRFRTISRFFDHFPIVNDPEDFFQSSKNKIICLYNDNKNTLWVGTSESGLLQFDPRTAQFSDMRNRLPENDISPDNSFLTIIQDKNGLYWIGTSYKGMVKLVPDPHAFHEIVRSYSIYGIIEPQPGIFWFGTQDGVLIHDREKKTDRFLKHQQFNPGSITGNLVTNLINDPPYVWICTRTGLNRYNPVTGKNRAFIAGEGENSVSGKEFWNVCKDHLGKYWFSSDNGISRWDPETDRITNYKHDPDNPNSLSNNYCLQIIESRPGNLLISTQHGLNEFSPQTNQWKVYLPLPDNLLSISSEYVFGVFRDNQGELWVYTNGGGFCFFDETTGTFERYTIEDGLSDNIVYGIHEDKDGIFWLITNNGLSRFDPRDDKFNIFDVQDGLFSNEFNINSITEGTNGEILLGGVNGANAFIPQTTTLRTSKTPEIRLSSFIIHADTASYEIPVTDTIIRIRSADNTFSISFSLMDYLNPFKNQYTYFLENFDEGPTRLAPGLHQVDYRKVPPGHYVFRVSGTNSLDVPSERLSTTIIVVPAWNETLLFKVLIVAAILLIAGLVIFFRINSLHNRHEMEKQLLTIQNELIRSQKFALRSQMNPHFIFNSLNSIQNFVLKNDVDSANYYLSNFSTLMRKVLEYSQYNFITLNEELEMNKLYLKMEHMRFSRKFEMEIRVDPAIDQHLVRIPPMLLQPYLENAILHGLQLIKHKGLLQLLIDDHDTFMTINIVDNGIGRERAKAIRERAGHKSQGLANIEKRIQLYNKISVKPITVKIIDVCDTKGEAAGTRIEINVPYDMEEHSQEIL